MDDSAPQTRRPWGRPGRPPLPPERRRQPWIELAASATERQQIELAAEAARLPVADFVRQAALGRRLVAAPPVGNLLAWRALAALHANFNQVVRHLNQRALVGEALDLTSLPAQIEALNLAVAGLRAQLLGADPSAESDEK
jgi:uncharacterized protein (DUF1778 family)